MRTAVVSEHARTDELEPLVAGGDPRTTTPPTMALPMIAGFSSVETRSRRADASENQYIAVIPPISATAQMGSR